MAHPKAVPGINALGITVASAPSQGRGLAGGQGQGPGLGASRGYGGGRARAQGKQGRASGQKAVGAQGLRLPGLQRLGIARGAALGMGLPKPEGTSHHDRERGTGFKLAQPG